MKGKRVLGMIGLDLAGGVIARGAMESGASVLFLDRDGGEVPASTRLRGLAWPGGRPAKEGENPSSFSVVRDLEGLVSGLEAPRLVLVCLGAEDAAMTTADISGLVERLEPGDQVLACVDGSRAAFSDLSRRCSAKGLACIDLGTVGLGPGGEPLATAGSVDEEWARASRILGEGSATFLAGKPGSGYLASLLRESAEGLELELLSESYHLMRTVLRISNDEMRPILAKWNSGDTRDPLLATAADALGLMDEDGLSLIDKVLDLPAATGACAVAAALALEAGVPAPMTCHAAFARAVAARKDERVAASAVLGGPKVAPTGDRAPMVEELRKAFCAASILGAAEALSLLESLSERRGLGLDPGRVARAWAVNKGSRAWELAAEAVSRSGSRTSVLLDAGVKTILDQTLPSLRRLSARAQEGGIPLPAFSAALASYDSSRSTWLPANLSEALLDSLYGSGFERIDRPRGTRFHSEWK